MYVCLFVYCLLFTVISSCEELSSLGGGKLDDISDESARNISRQADVLDRQLKSIEHVSQ